MRWMLRLAALAVLAIVVAACQESGAQPEGETMRLSYRPVLDPAAGGGEAFRFLAPEDWIVSGPGVVWNIGYRNGGVAAVLDVADPVRTRGFGYLPYLPRHWIEPPLPGFPEGSFYGIHGSITTPPLSAVDYLELVAIPESFPPATQLIGSQTLPDVAAAVARAEGLAEVDAARSRIVFSDGARELEAHVYAWIRYDTLGTTTFWSPANLYLVYAAPGELDSQGAFLNTLALSYIVNPEWTEYVRLVEELRISGNQQLQGQIEQLAAAIGQASQEIFDFTTEGFRRAQASNDIIFENLGEAIRGTETYADPGVGPIELPGGFEEVWSTGGGEFILSNDPLFDPNLGNSPLDWQRIEPTN